MPYKCCVPNCNGNQKNGPKVSVFKFPKSEIIKKKWIAAIKMKNLKLCNSSRVCILHFKRDDIETETSFLDEKSGRVITAPLTYPRVRSDAVPSVFPDKYHFKSNDKNKGSYTKRKILSIEDKKVKGATFTSTENNTHESVQLDGFVQEFFTLDELHERLSGINLGCWEVIKKTASTYLFYFVDVEYPCVKCFIKITSNLQLSLYYKNTSVSSLPNLKVTFPLKVNTLDELQKLLEDVKIVVDNDFDVKSVEDNIKLINDLFVSLANKLPNKEVIFAIQGKWLMENS